MHLARRFAALAGVAVIALTATSCTVKPGQASSAEDAVKGFLTALSDGRAGDALAFTDATPSDPRFVTDDFYATARSLAPVTDVTTYSVDSTDVSASFDLGGASTNADFQSTQDSAGHWFVSNPLIGVDTSWADTWLGLTLNGVSLDSASTSRIDLLPGGYRFATTNPDISIDMAFTAKPDSGSSPMFETDGYPFSVDLSEAGSAALVQFVTSSLASCLSEHSLTLSCGITTQGQQTFGDIYRPVMLDDIDVSTVAWSTQWQPDASEFDVLQRQDNSVYVGSQITVTVSGKSTDGRQFSQPIDLWGRLVVEDYSAPSAWQLKFEPWN